ncbi:GlxA family transcriptional regulator [Chitinimonas naiadis]
MWDQAPPSTMQRYGFLLSPDFPLGGLSPVLEVLTAANELLGEPRYRTVLLSRDGGPVTAAQGVRISVNDNLHKGLALDGLFVISGQPPVAGEFDTAMLDILRTYASLGCLLVGIGCGASILAKAGLLRGYRATQQWTYLDTLSDDHPQCIVSANLFEIDRNRLSCGNTGSGDMLLTWLGQRHGSKLVNDIVAHLGLERVRSADERPQANNSARASGGSVHLSEALALMEANLAEPLATEEVARLVGVSRRQLERLFKQHLDELPSRYYLGLRLKRARRLLQQSSQSILQIGLACGFASGPHFSTAYRAHFGRSPRDERTERVAYWRAEPTSAGE